MISFKLFQRSLAATDEPLGAIYRIISDVEKDESDKVVFKRLQANTQTYAEGPHAKGITTVDDSVAPDCFTPRIPTAAIEALNTFVFSGTFYMFTVVDSADYLIIELDSVGLVDSSRQPVPFLFNPRTGSFILLLANDCLPGLSIIGGAFQVCRCSDPFAVAARYKRVRFTTNAYGYREYFIKHNGKLFRIAPGAPDFTTTIKVAQEQQTELFTLLSTALAKVNQVAGYNRVRKVIFEATEDKPIKEDDLDAFLYDCAQSTRCHEKMAYTIISYNGRSLYIDGTVPTSATFPIHRLATVSIGESGVALLKCEDEGLRQSLELCTKVWFGQDAADVVSTDLVPDHIDVPQREYARTHNLFRVCFSNTVQIDTSSMSCIYNEQRYMHMTFLVLSSTGDTYMADMALDLTTGNLIL